MRAIRLFKIGEALQQQDIPAPNVMEKEVLVRIRAAGICHSDVHYRAGASPVGPLPQTLGHEVAGVVEKVGAGVRSVGVGDRVCLHYLLTCGECYFCRNGHEQFCPQGRMIGKHCDGGFAEYIVVPARNAVPIPDGVSFEQAAVLMCSTATSFHALRKGRLQPGETVAVFGVGGLGMSAIQLARACGALQVYAVDINAARLQLAGRFGAIAVNAAQEDPVAQLRRLTDGRGVDVALELIGLPLTMRQAVQCLGVLGRAVLVGLCDRPFEIDSYRELLGKEAEVIGASDHLLHELPVLLEFVRQGRLDLSQVISRTIPLDVVAVNEVMDALEHFGEGVRTVITP
ncbi:MAG: alcohol dehydrogenase catalytic domain-containing protein [Chloroflexota bacterium]